MNHKELLNYCEKRIPFGVMRSILKEMDMPTHQGWSKTKANYLIQAEKDALFKEKLMQLKTIYFEHLLSGEKTVRLYKVSPSKLSEFVDSLDIDRLVDAKTPYSDNYPYPIKNLDLVNDEVYLTDARFFQGGLMLAYCSSRKIEEHVKLKLSDLDQSTKTTYFNNFQELYGTRSYKRQLFDFIFINAEKGYIELRVDSASDLSIKDQFKSLHKLKRKLLELKEGTNLSKEVLVEYNLYPIIWKLYDSEEGRVCELAFSVNTGAVMHEKMRSKDVDIRTEDFHCGGIEAVDRIIPYKIAVEWSFVGSSDENVFKPELMLSSTLRETYEATPSLYDAHISKCASVKQYNLIFDKLL